MFPKFYIFTKRHSNFSKNNAEDELVIRVKEWSTFSNDFYENFCNERDSGKNELLYNCD